MRRVLLILSVVLLCSSCGEKRDFKPTHPVTGVIHVDGKPVEQLAVKCADLAGIDEASPTYSSAFTDAAGKFEISTYKKGDGVPAGSYALTVVWGKLNLMSGQYGGPDKLKGKYDDPKTSTIKFDVVAGQPTDLGTIELTSK